VVIAKANALENEHIPEVTHSLVTAFNTMLELDGKWKSAGSMKFLTNFRELRDDVIEAVKVLKEYAHDLRYIATAFDEAETEITVDAGGLETDVFETY